MDGDHYGIDLLSLTEWPSAQIRACIVGCACVHHWRDRKSDLFAALLIIFPQKQLVGVSGNPGLLLVKKEDEKEDPMQRTFKLIL